MLTVNITAKRYRYHSQSTRETIAQTPQRKIEKKNEGENRYDIKHVITLFQNAMLIDQIFYGIMHAVQIRMIKQSTYLLWFTQETQYDRYYDDGDELSFYRKQN